jgi:peptide/nickel transport system ATP-binding protein
MTPLLDVRDLTIVFRPAHGAPHVAVDRASFGMDAAARHGLVGESGSGKSTILLAILGLLPASATVSGEIRFDGENLLELSESQMRTRRWTDVAMVFQGSMNALNPVMSVGQQIEEPMRCHGQVARAAARARTKELLTSVDLPLRVADAYPHQLSGGMRQRAVIAMALASEPRLLLADEPTTSLDVLVQSQIVDLLVSLASERDMATLLVSHDLPLVLSRCDSASVMRDGAIVEQGPSGRLAHDARHEYTRVLVAAAGDMHEGASAANA